MVLLASNLSISYAQITISGGSSVNGSYGTMTSAITALNGATISGPVVVDVNAGTSFVEDLPEITFTGTLSNTITIQKSGVGANPVITPNLGGAIASSTTIGVNGDGIIVINGGDFITFDGIDVQTNPSLTGNAKIEYGYYLKKASATNACKNIIIRNANITLDKTTIFSFGIFVSNISGTATVTVTSVDGRSENISIYNNNISNTYGGIQLRGYASSAPYDLYDQNIYVGTDGTNSITNYGGGATAVHGIYTINQNNCNISNNNIIGGDGSTSTHYGIFLTTSNNANYVVENNFIDMTNSSTTSQTTAIYSNIGTTGNTDNTVSIINNILTINRPSATSGVTYFIYSASNYPFNFNITGNTIENSTLAGTGALYGFYNISNPTNLNISNNLIRNITRTSTTSTALFYGISNGSGTVANSTISNNTIYDLIGNGSTGAVGGIVVGTTTNVSTINNNKIYNISSTNAAGVVYGITQNSGSLVSNIYNNYISELNSSLTSSATDAIRGINLTGTTANSTTNISYNTVYLNASSSGTNFSTSALYHTYSATSTTNSLVLKNNILVNLSTPMGTGITSAFRRSASTDLNNFAMVSNNNLFYAGASSPTNLIYYDGTNSDQTLAAFKSRVSPRESVSITESPNFVSTTPTDPTYLHINTSIATQIEGGGVDIPGITLDYDGDSRSSIPDIGADEFSGIPIDLNPPNISYSPLINSCDGSARMLVATISDATGVPTSGAGLPTLYWKINAGAWNPSTGSNTNVNEYTFTFGAGAALNDSISYYIAAQDLAMTPNIGTFPSTGSSGFTPNPPAASTPPTSVSSYKIIATLNGMYNVGVGGDFTTLTSAIAAYNTSCLTGPVVFNLTDATYSSSETFPIVINASNYSSSTNTLTIKPSSGNNASITGTVATGSIIKLNGADHIIIDGSNNGTSSRNLTIQNLTTTTTGNAVVWIASPAANNGSNENVVKNCVIEGNSSTTTFFGAFVGGNTSITTTAAGLANNNNNTFGNNLFRKTLYGLVFFAYAANSPDLNNVIINNNFGTSVAGEGFQNEGIRIDRQDGMLIYGNEIQNLVSSTTTSQHGMILLDFKNGQCLNNKIHDIISTSTSTTPRQYGILVRSSTYSSSGNPSLALIANNFISKINTTATSTTTWNNTGICASSGYGDQYYHNTVHLTGQLNNSTAGLTAAFSVGDGGSSTACTDVIVKNNIFNVEGSSLGGNVWAFYTTATSIGGSVFDHNLLRCAGTGATNNTGRYNGVNYVSLGDWQTGTGQDANSIAVQPLFISATDLHLFPNNIGIDNLGTMVSVSDDIDNQTRSMTTPDLGADEFTAVIGNDIGAIALINPIVSGCKTSSETVTVRIKNFNVTTIDFAVNPVTITTNISGAVTQILSATVNSGTLLPGAEINVDMSTTLDMTNQGQYIFDAYTTIVGADVFNGNDTLSTTTVINAILGGTYTVGTAGQFPSLTAASIVYNNANCVLGPVEFNLIDATYDVNEIFPIVFNQNSLFNAVNNLTIKPSNGNTAIISGSSANAIIKLNGGDFITIDGSNNGSNTKDLTIENTNNVTQTAAIWLSSVAPGNGCTNNTVKNLNLKCGVPQNTSALLTYGIIMNGATISTTVNGVDNDNNTFSDNNITKVRYGIVTRGTAAGNNNFNINVINNKIGPDSGNGPEQIGKTGILMQADSFANVTGNIIQFVGGDFNNTSAGADRMGIAIGSDATNSITTTTITSGDYNVQNNVIMNVIDERAFSGVGIYVGTTRGGSATNNVIANNTISNIKSNGTGGDLAVGIQYAGGVDDKIVFNSINLFGDVDPTSGSANTTGYGAGIRISSNSGASGANHNNLTLKNNNIKVDLFSTNSPLVRYYAIVGFGTANPSAYSFGTGGSDNNNYYVNPLNPQCALAGISGGTANDSALFEFLTLPAYQSAYAAAQDANSVNIAVEFQSTTDLHIKQSNGNLPFANLGSPIGGITSDIDNDTRNVSTPDIGADEFTLISCSGLPNAGVISPALAQKCFGETQSMSVSGASQAVGISFQWKVSSTSGSGYVNVTGGSGATTENYTTGVLAVGTYYFVMETTCSASGQMNMSNEFALTINPIPTVNVNPSSSTICYPGGSPAVLTASGGVTYTWSPTIGLSSGSGAIVNALPSDTTTYTVLVTDINGCTNTASADVNVNLGPSLSTSATFNSICEGNSTTITANSGGIQQLTVGTATTTIGGNDGNPYRSGNGNGNQIRTQLLYTAADLTTAGFSAGPITGLGFTTTAVGGTVGSFSIAIGQTNVSTLNTNFETSSLTSVFTQASFTPQVGLNMHLFNVSSFNWDGISNLLLDICQTNIVQGTTTVSAYTPGFNSNNHRASTTTSCSSLTGVIVANKPIVTLLGTTNNNGLFTFTWQPGNLSGNQIMVSPTSTTTYTVTASGSNGCEDTDDETIVVNGTVVNSQLNAGGGSLRDVYACINEGGTITYNTGMNIDSSFLTAPLVIGKNVTIQGNGNVLLDFQGSMANGLLINAAKILTLENMNVNGGNGVTSTLVNNGILNLKSSTINGSNLPVVQNNNGASVEAIENSGQSNIKQN